MKKSLSIGCVVLTFALAVGLLCLKNVSGVWVAAAPTHACGGFLFLAVHTALGQPLKHHKALALANLAAGFGLIGTLALRLRLF